MVREIEDLEKVFDDVVNVFCAENEPDVIRDWLHVCLGSRLLRASSLLCTLPMEEQLESLAARHPTAEPRIREFLDALRAAANVPSELRQLRAEVLGIEARIDALVQQIGYADLREEGVQLAVLVFGKLEGIMEVAEQLSAMVGEEDATSVENEA